MTARSTMDLMQIAGAGGGLDINVGAKSTHDLAQIAAAAARGKCQVIFRGLGARSTMDLAQIGSAGYGHVIFDLE